MKKALLFLGVVFGGSLAQAQPMQMWTTTQHGGPLSWGTIMKINSDGTGFNVMHSFDFTYGGTPMGNIMQASDGNIYGTCYDGGVFASCCIWRCTPTGTYTDLYDFDISHGDFPTSGMVQINNKLWGAASGGGSHGSGVIYTWDLTGGAYNDEYNIDGSVSGNIYEPYGAPILASNGKLYGTAMAGGINNQGGLYSYDPSNNTYTQLYTFGTNTNDGVIPYGGLFQASNGKLYGMTSDGGLNNMGTIFSFDPSNNTYTKLYDCTAAGGASPRAGLCQDANGLLYGSMIQGGTNNTGTIFSFNPVGNVFTKLHDFSTVDGNSPQSDLTVDANGVLYGTTSIGGANGGGTMFSFNTSNSMFTVLYALTSSTSGYNSNAALTVVSTPQGIAPHSASTLELGLSPNPATDHLTISYQSPADADAQFAVRNALGETVMSWNAHTSSTLQNETVDLHTLSSGLYFVECVSGATKTVQRFVKE